MKHKHLGWLATTYTGVLEEKQKGLWLFKLDRHANT